MAERLTDATVRKALPPLRGQAFLWDETVKGLALRIRQRRITIGNYPDWTVQAARGAAKDLKRSIDLGQDPMGERHAVREAPTMQDLWERYQTEKLSKKAARTQIDETSMWQKIILPRFAKTRLAEITYKDLNDFHRDITKVRKTPVRANRVIDVLRGAFNLAIRWGWLQNNPAQGIQRNPEEKRERYLDKREMSALAQALSEHREIASVSAIRFLMLTGARRGEVLGATWDMFDLEQGIWTKPSAHTKQRRVHRVPLSIPAVALLKSIRSDASGKYVFSRSGSAPLIDIKRTWATVCRKAGFVTQRPKLTRSGRRVLDNAGRPALIEKSNLRMHDLRHSFASILVSAGASLPLIGQLLGHTQVQTTQRYAHLFDAPMRQAAEVVGQFVAAPASSARLKRIARRPGH